MDELRACFLMQNAGILTTRALVRVSIMSDAYDFLRYDYTLMDTEDYLRKVVQRKYDTANAHRIFEALALAYDTHAEQFRANNVPYVIHPMRVALMLVNFDGSTTSKVFIAALLHDTLEDTCLTSQEIGQKFGKYVAKLVQSVTIPYDTNEDFHVKGDMKREKWQEIMLDSHEARAIKTFEDLDNMIGWKTIPEGSPLRNKIPRWLDEARELSLPLAHATSMKAYELMQREYTYYAEQGYANQQITL
jgi:GTP diphosphokinase / guanosine-3',5'-bis(diphosphate) 3'-diphosphatase